MPGARLPEDEMETKGGEPSHSNKTSQTFVTFQVHVSSHILSDIDSSLLKKHPLPFSSALPGTSQNCELPVPQE